MLNAFWRVAPSVRFSFLAICAAVVFFFAIVFEFTNFGRSPGAPLLLLS